MQGTAAGGPQLFAPSASAPTAAYPPAQATHEAVVADRQLFMRTLRNLHETLGTQFRIPMVSGRELDLHLLYIQVTAMGGLEAVITAKKWTEVSQPFHFPTSFTSKSFTLRKMYTRLLHDYEQVYFHRNTGPPTLPPGADGTKLEGGAAMTSSNPVYKRRRLDLAAPATAEAAAAPQTPPALVAFPGGGVPMPRPTRGSLTGTPLAGSVDAEFDMGYFVTITAGGQEFKGVLYTPPAPLFGMAAPAAPAGPLQMPAQVFPREQQQQQPAAPAQPVLPRQASLPQRRGRASRRDPLEPKQNKTPFNFFSIDARARAKAANPSADQKEISKIVGDMWQRASQDEKQPYIEQARADKLRYQQALSEYQQRLADQQALEEEGAGPSSTVGAEGGDVKSEQAGAAGPSHFALTTPLQSPLMRFPPHPIATGSASPRYGYDQPGERQSVSPREQEAAQQMQQLHRGFAAPAETPESPARAGPSGQPPHGYAPAGEASQQRLGSFMRQQQQLELEAEREEYEDEGSDEEA